MSLINKLLISSLVLSFVSAAANPSFAAEDEKADAKEEQTSDAGAVIFRIENIQPVLNDEGITEKCKFTFTVYNRMEQEIAEANLKLSWEDNIEDKYKIVGGNIKANDAKAALQVLEKEITFQTLPPHIQRSFDDVIETNKCFLLLDQLEFEVKNCTFSDEAATAKSKDSKDNKQAAGGCTDKFNYINSQNPEYYSEFKDMPDSDIEKQADAEKVEELEKIQEIHNGIKADMENIKTTLQRIN